MNGPDRREIAARIRGLIAGQDGGDLAETARRLRVDEMSLRMSIDEDSPYPTIDVLTSVVESYGVDPTYLLTGRYDAETHRRALDTPADAPEAIRRLAEAQSGRRPIAEPAEERGLRLG